MVQNLELGLATGIRLTADSTDITDDWVPLSDTSSIALEAKKLDPYVQGGYSWSFGKVVLATPLDAKGCNTYNNNDGAYSIDNLAEVCANVGFVDVSGEEWKPNFVAKEGSFAYSDGRMYSGLVAVDVEAKTYDAHYLVGNYYQFSAASAGASLENPIHNSAVQESICPKGWQLPASGRDSQGIVLARNRSFYKLLLSYGGPEAKDYIFDENDGPYTSLEALTSNIAVSPLSFVRSGYANIDTGSFKYLGKSGFYLSNNALGHYVARLMFNDTDVYPSANYSGYYGYSIRCVAR